MLRFAKAFLDIALWRKSPAQLPASGLLLYPLGALLNIIGFGGPAAVPLGVLLLVGLVWYLLACANIWRAALDARLGLGAAISLGYLLLSMVLDQRVRPQNLT